MNREIKFRAWDKKEKRWVFTILYPNTVSIPCPKYTKSSLLNHEGHPEAFALPNLEGWYQFTGLKDKNGKEIWEGDVVQFPDKIQRYGHVATDVVKYQDGGFWPFTDPYLPVAPSELEVIGNTFENPNLLQEPK